MTEDEFRAWLARLEQPQTDAGGVATEDNGAESSPRVLTPMRDGVQRAEETVPGHRALTQLGNAERMVDRHGSRFRYCPPLGHFFVWDGRRWREDDQGTAIRKLACATVRGIYAELAEDGDLAAAERELLTKHAVRSESDRSIEGMVKLVRSLPGVSVEPEVFDADPYLLNVRNGTIDLRTGEVRKHRREDFLSQMAPVSYDPAAEASLFLAFLQRIFDGDIELISFVQRFLGYCLTGECTEQVLGVCYGSGKNGKSTMLTLMHDVLGGDYAVQLRPDFLLSRKWEAHPEEVAQLRGRRFACAVEVAGGAKLDEVRVKHLTGNDRISARRMYGSSFDFRPSHKFLVGVNDKPQVQGMDEAIWRRLLLIPFQVQIPEAERDPDLGRKLRAEASGVLAWLVRGCLEWRRLRLSPPAVVVEASAEYRREMDSVRQFLDSEACLLGPGLRTRKAALRATYERWCESESVQPVSPRQWATQLRRHGLTDGKFGHESARAWCGVALAGTSVRTGDDE
jgi:putative DNA primase/helicase